MSSRVKRSFWHPEITEGMEEGSRRNCTWSFGKEERTADRSFWRWGLFSDRSFQYCNILRRFCSKASQDRRRWVISPRICLPGQRRQYPSGFSFDQCLACQSEMYWPLRRRETTKALFISQGLLAQVVQRGCGLVRLRNWGLKNSRESLSEASNSNFFSSSR